MLAACAQLWPRTAPLRGARASLNGAAHAVRGAVCGRAAALTSKKPPAVVWPPTHLKPAPALTCIDTAVLLSAVRSWCKQVEWTTDRTNECVFLGPAHLRPQTKMKKRPTMFKRPLPSLVLVLRWQPQGGMNTCSLCPQRKAHGLKCGAVL